jgi:hypothetical protein
MEGLSETFNTFSSEITWVNDTQLHTIICPACDEPINCVGSNGCRNYRIYFCDCCKKSVFCCSKCSNHETCYIMKLNDIEEITTDQDYDNKLNCDKCQT